MLAGIHDARTYYVDHADEARTLHDNVAKLKARFKDDRRALPEAA